MKNKYGLTEGDEVFVAGYTYKIVLEEGELKLQHGATYTYPLTNLDLPQSKGWYKNE